MFLETIAPAVQLAAYLTAETIDLSTFIQ